VKVKENRQGDRESARLELLISLTQQVDRALVRVIKLQEFIVGELRKGRFG